jgi:hypothetical protein
MLATELQRKERGNLWAGGMEKAVNVEEFGQYEWVDGGDGAGLRMNTLSSRLYGLTTRSRRSGVTVRLNMRETTVSEVFRTSQIRELDAGSSLQHSLSWLK